MGWWVVQWCIIPFRLTKRLFLGHIKYNNHNNYNLTWNTIEHNIKILGKPVGNDKEHGKCTYVSKYGLEGAKEILNKITKEAIEIINCYGEKGEFLKELALYIANRNK